MIGMMMSPTSEVTMPPNATPMMTPTARSITLPLIANSRNSLSILSPFSSTLLTGGRTVEALVDEAGMHHGAAHRQPRRPGDRHHRQAQLLVDLAEQRQGVFHRRRIGLHVEIGVQRHQLVVQLQRRCDIALLPRHMKFGAQPRRDVGGDRNAAVTAMRHVT